jgi:hypothetical protein
MINRCVRHEGCRACQSLIATGSEDVERRPARCGAVARLVRGQCGHVHPSSVKSYTGVMLPAATVRRMPIVSSRAETPSSTAGDAQLRKCTRNRRHSSCTPRGQEVTNVQATCDDLRSCLDGRLSCVCGSGPWSGGSRACRDTGSRGSERRHRCTETFCGVDAVEEAYEASQEARRCDDHAQERHAQAVTSARTDVVSVRAPFRASRAPSRCAVPCWARGVPHHLQRRPARCANARIRMRLAAAA